MTGITSARGTEVQPGGPEMQALWGAGHRDAWRLELLDVYRVPGGDAQAAAEHWAGRHPDMGFMEDWADMLRARASAGQSTGRVHVVTEPLSVYADYELRWGYAVSVPAGEDVRICGIPAGQQRPGWARGVDFWLFTGGDGPDTVAWMLYSRHGRLASVRLDSSPREVRRAARARDSAVAASVPYAEYMDGLASLSDAR